VDEEIIRILREANQKTITLAPEAGSETLRREIHKPITDDEIISACEIALQGGIQKIKLYFILGLPTETHDDIVAVIELVKEILKISPKPKVDLSINPFIPKPHTPLQYAPMLAIGEYRQRLKVIRKALNKLVFGRISGLDPRWARIQTLLSIGGEGLSPILERASQYGGTLGAWRRALKDHQKTIEEFVEVPRNPDQKQPWDHIRP
jgi:radical SAM superfamily enzyme YgiQ (UPF0313 family)